MKKILIPIAVVAALAAVGLALSWSQIKGAKGLLGGAGEGTEIATGLTLPEGFVATVFAEGLGDPRVIIHDNAGNILVSAPDEGKVFAVSLEDLDRDGKSDSVSEVLSGLKSPHGLEFDYASSTLYVAETEALSRYAYDKVTLAATGREELGKLPSGGGHSTRSLHFLPYPENATLLVASGSSCNVCEEDDPMRAAIYAFDTGSKVLTPYARGLRNTVFMETHPVTGKVFGTEMGRDLLGDDVPPDEVNVIEKDKNYGWPVCYGKNVHDTDFDKKTYIRNPCMAPFETPSHIDLQAHSAPLGLAFIPEEGWPEDSWFDMLVAYHGSWNRSVPTGYKIVRIDMDAQGNPVMGADGKPKATDFVTGWIKADGSVPGRPADILVLPGGDMYVSDDKAGVVYKISRS